MFFILFSNAENHRHFYLFCFPAQQVRLQVWQLTVSTFPLIISIGLSPTKQVDWFSLVWFYGISTFVGYSMPNPFLLI